MAFIVAGVGIIDFDRSAYVAFHQFLAVRQRRHKFDDLVSILSTIATTMAPIIPYPFTMAQSAVDFSAVSSAIGAVMVVYPNSTFLF